MRLLVIGGSGHVGKLVLPYLAQKHKVRVFDLVEPPPGPWDYEIGDLLDITCLGRNMAQMDALLYMAMNTQNSPGSHSTVANAFDVNVKGLYFSLWAASDNGVPHAVYTSTMSVYKERSGPYPDEAQPPDATDYYGLTKRLGEEVCKAWVAENKISVTALRLCFPVADDAPAPNDSQFKATTFTRASDVARAVLAALEYRHGFEAFSISGDSEGRMIQLGKAKRLLGWEPTPRPGPGQATAGTMTERVTSMDVTHDDR